MVLDRLDRPLPRKMEVFAYNLTKPKYSYKQASISFFVNHGPRDLTTLVLMALFETFGNVCDP